MDIDDGVTGTPQPLRVTLEVSADDGTSFNVPAANPRHGALKAPLHQPGSGNPGISYTPQFGADLRGMERLHRCARLGFLD